jgi:hypothetical protein
MFVSSFTCCKDGNAERMKDRVLDRASKHPPVRTKSRGAGYTAARTEGMLTAGRIESPCSQDAWDRKEAGRRHGDCAAQSARPTQGKPSWAPMGGQG